MFRILSAPLAVAILFSTGATASAADAPFNCDKAVSTPELNACADRIFGAADAKLNAAYKQVLAFIKSTGNAKPYDPVNWEKALRASQKAWVSFRDADCAGLVPMSWGGGTGTTSAVLECKTSKTEARTKDLIAIYKSE
jgi:uncharacterized protein YecT (DUF1311 family)